MEKRLVEKINDVRASHGLRQLRIGTGLNAEARTLVAPPGAP